MLNSPPQFECILAIFKYPCHISCCSRNSPPDFERVVDQVELIGEHGCTRKGRSRAKVEYASGFVNASAI